MLERVVLETSGVADPGPIAHAIHADPRIAPRVRLAGITCVLDVPRAFELLKDHEEARRQLELSDRVVLTQTDLADPVEAEAVRAEVQRRYPGRPVRTAVAGDLDPGFLLEPAQLGSLDAQAWLRSAHGGAEPDLEVTTLAFEGPVHLPALFLWQRLTAGIEGRALLRVKGVVEDADGARWLLQSAQSSVHPPLRLPPAETRGSRLVIMTRGMDAPHRAQLLRAAELAAKAVPRAETGAETSAWAPS